MGLHIQFITPKGTHSRNFSMLSFQQKTPFEMRCKPSCYKLFGTLPTHWALCHFLNFSTFNTFTQNQISLYHALMEWDEILGCGCDHLFASLFFCFSKEVGDVTFGYVKPLLLSFEALEALEDSLRHLLVGAGSQRWHPSRIGHFCNINESIWLEMQQEDIMSRGHYAWKRTLWFHN